MLSIFRCLNHLPWNSLNALICYLYSFEMRIPAIYILWIQTQKLKISVERLEYQQKVLLFSQTILYCILFNKFF